MIETVVTDDLTTSDASACEGLVRTAFGDHYTAHDWVHALGGTHVVLRDGERIVGHAAVVPRLLAHDGEELDGGYVEAVAVDPTLRGTGLGGELMTAIESEIVRSGALGVLNSLPGAVDFYESRGWVRWRGQLGGIGNIDEPDQSDPDDPDSSDTVMVFRPPPRIDVDGVLRINNRVGSRW